MPILTPAFSTELEVLAKSDMKESKREEVKLYLQMTLSLKIQPKKKEIQQGWRR